MLRYDRVVPAVFMKRLNRFVARVNINGEECLCHVKTTGRCAELLYDGAPVWVQLHPGGNRKTPCSLIAAQKGERLVNIDSQAPNKVFARWLAEGGLQEPFHGLRPEYAYGRSRFDFLITAGGRRILCEVKGVTLETGGVALFPDAPTARGLKHVRELCRAAADGYEAMLAFVIQMKGVRVFAPNIAADSAFSRALAEAKEQGVRLLAFDCVVTPDSIAPGSPVEIRLG